MTLQYKALEGGLFWSQPKCGPCGGLICALQAGREQKEDRMHILSAAKPNIFTDLQILFDFIRFTQ